MQNEKSLTDDNAVHLKATRQDSCEKLRAPTQLEIVPHRLRWPAYGSSLVQVLCGMATEHHMERSNILKLQLHSVANTSIELAWVLRESPSKTHWNATRHRDVRHYKRFKNTSSQKRQDKCHGVAKIVSTYQTGHDRTARAHLEHSLAFQVIQEKTAGRRNPQSSLQENNNEMAPTPPPWKTEYTDDEWNILFLLIHGLGAHGSGRNDPRSTVASALGLYTGVQNTSRPTITIETFWTV